MHFENAGRPVRMHAWLWSMTMAFCMALLAPVASADESSSPADCGITQGAPATVAEPPTGCTQPGQTDRTGKPASPGPARNKSLLREYLEDESYGEAKVDRRKLLVIVAPQRAARA